MSDSDFQRKHALECLRLAADCTNLSRELENPALLAHFARMAEVWSELAELGPDAITRPYVLN